MNRSVFRMSRLMLPCALTLLAGGACSSKDSSTTTPPPNTVNSLVMFFSPNMYSAFDGVHSFKIPVVVDNVDPTAVVWKASDPSMVNIVYDATLQGAMIETRKAGKVTITATVGDQTGSSTLNITQASSADWDVGNMRYNNGIVLTALPTGAARPDGGLNVSCTNCHGDTASGTTNQFRTVAHTPEQTGGFSDDDLIGIFTMGRVPAGAYFDTSVVPYQQWQGFHVWQMLPDEAKGVIVYLRALTPQTQTGVRGAFGGRGNQNRRDAAAGN